MKKTISTVDMENSTVRSMEKIVMPMKMIMMILIYVEGRSVLHQKVLLSWAFTDPSGQLQPSLRPLTPQQEL